MVEKSWSSSEWNGFGICRNLSSESAESTEDARVCTTVGIPAGVACSVVSDGGDLCRPKDRSLSAMPAC